MSKKNELKKDVVEVLGEYPYPLSLRRIKYLVKELRVTRALKQLEEEDKIEETVNGWRLKR